MWGWLGSTDPAEFRMVARTISGIERDRRETCHRKLNERRSETREASKRDLPVPSPSRLFRGGRRRPLPRLLLVREGRLARGDAELHLHEGVRLRGRLVPGPLAQ